MCFGDFDMLEIILIIANLIIALFLGIFLIFILNIQRYNMLERIIENLKTTMAGVTTAIVTIIAVFGFEADPNIVTACLTVVVVILGMFAKD